nr:hypothetical protein GCM10020093_025260 [Planobispora longispora]
MLNVLVLGGTDEARRLAAALAGRAGTHVVSSLAGRVRDPKLPVGEVREGGFGGPAGLAAWLEERRIDAVVDATHPFAARMTASAAEAARATGLPLLILRRPGWRPGPGDDWRPVPSLEAAAELLPALGSGCSSPPAAAACRSSRAWTGCGSWPARWTRPSRRCRAGRRCCSAGAPSPWRASWP